MCGIVGKIFLDFDKSVNSELIQRMMDIIAHRGPDGEGKFISGPVGLGHRRLSIIDLNTGDQPMCNEDETIWIVFNGEIYNYIELREDLIKRGHKFRSTSDTEVIIHLYEEKGAECVQDLQGMFTFAIWDSRASILFIARDRVGIKPLYYADTGHAVLFGSELKSLLVDPDVSRDLNPQVIETFLTFNYVPGSETLFRNINKLEPGHYILVQRKGVTKRQYWDLLFQPSMEFNSLEQSAEALSEILKQTVTDHMISDVPVGFLASGGVDSTAILSYAVEETDKTIQTFTVGFSDSDFADERPYARLAAKRFGSTHHEITISSDEFRNFLPDYTWYMEEPVCEPPAVALYYISKLARNHVKVLISGEGGDEAFAGYPEYRNYLIFEKFKKICGPFKAVFGKVLEIVGNMTYISRIRKYAPLMRLLPDQYFYSRVGSPVGFLFRNRSELYSSELLHSVDTSGPARLMKQFYENNKNQGLLNQMLYIDTKTYLPDDLLVKADKMTMANSLELRVPFLDHKVLEFAAKLPVKFKVNKFETKCVLKQAFKDRVPAEIINRKKTGFPVPIRKWVSNELKDYISDILLSRQAISRGYFQSKALEKLIKENSIHNENTDEIFLLLVLELWHQQFVDTP
jgi:asparagine synthase (glutamine-hydrolysing)